MSEFREDIVSGDWIIIAPERAKRPRDFLPPKKPRIHSPKAKCPFDHLQQTGNWPPIATLTKGDSWHVIMIPNKFPAVRHHEDTCAVEHRDGPYTSVTGIGHHELLVFRDHRTPLDAVPVSDLTDAFKLVSRRLTALRRDVCLSYASLFFNWGPTAGASLSHPHFQMLALPIIPPDISHSLHGSKRYYKKHRACVHCVMIAKERADRVRVIAENKAAVVVAPYASHEPFEIRIYPKRHLPYFERTGAADMRGIAEMLQETLRAVKRHLHDADLNFFVHTAPIRDEKEYRHYHWHIEIIPKISTPGGFELSTGVIINSIDPALAAKVLRGEKIPDPRNHA